MGGEKGSTGDSPALLLRRVLLFLPACLPQGYPYWKAFTTGKSPTLGGVPHDT